jgi:hypothetical protein
MKQKSVCFPLHILFLFQDHGMKVNNLSFAPFSWLFPHSFVTIFASTELAKPSEAKNA